MDTVNTTILARVKKLLALATSSNPHEAATAAAQAQRLMDEHNLTVAHLDASDDPIGKEPLDGNVRGRLSSWRCSLAQRLADHNGAMALVSGGEIRLAGRASDVAMVRSLYEYLVREIDRLVKRDAHGRGRGYANAFRHGAVYTIGRKLDEERHAHARGSESSALVLVRGADVRRWVEDQHGTLRNRKIGSTTDARGFDTGMRAAEQIELRRSLPTTPDTHRLTR